MQGGISIPNNYDDINERESISEMAQSMKKSIKEQEFDEEDAFWYQNESPKPAQKAPQYEETFGGKESLWV